MTEDKGKNVRTLAEVHDAIRALTDADWRRLKLVASKYAFGEAIEPDDLLQRAIERSLEKDGRKWPRNVDFVKFLAEAMRSIADGEREKIENRVEKIPIQAPGNSNEEGDYVEIPHPSPNAEEKLGDDQDFAAMKASLLLVFINDPVARDILEGIWAGLSGEELREYAGLDKVEYESKRKQIRRQLSRHFPNGWKL